MSVTSTKRIKFWIFEHAAKHLMESVVKHLIHNDPEFNLNSFNSEEISSHIDPTFYMLFLLKKLIITMQSTESWPSGRDRMLLQLMTELLETCYEQQQYMLVTEFAHLNTRMKLINMMGLFMEKASDTHIMQQQNLLFPHWNAAVKEEVARRFHVTNPKVLEKWEKVHTSIRRFILRIRVNESGRKTYLRKNFSDDLKKYVEVVVPLMNKVFLWMRERMPKSTIERIVDGSFKSSDINDPAAVELIPEYIKDCKNEEQVMTCLEALHSSPTIRMSEEWGSLSVRGGIETSVLETQMDQIDNALMNEEEIVNQQINTSQEIEAVNLTFTDSEAEEENEESFNSIIPETDPSVHRTDVSPCAVVLHYQKELSAGNDHKMYA